MWVGRWVRVRGEEGGGKWVKEERFGLERGEEQRVKIGDEGEDEDGL